MGFFSILRGNVPISKYDRKIIPSGLQSDSSQILIIIIFWPWCLFGLRMLIIFMISNVKNANVESDLQIFSKNLGKLTIVINNRTLLLKRSLKSWAFFLKSMINLPVFNRGGIQGIFLLFRKVFNSTTLDLFYCLIVYQIGMNNTFAWIPQLQFLNMLEDIETY